MPTSFRQIIDKAVKDKRFLVVPGAHDALSARLIQKIGFETYFIGGFPAVGGFGLRSEQVKVTDNEVRIIPVGLMRKLALNQEPQLDRREIRRAVAVDRSELPVRGHRVLGTGMPGLAAGRYRSGKSGASFWLAGRAPRLLLIDLEGGPLDFVVLQVRDPGQLAAQLHEPVRD